MTTATLGFNIESSKALDAAANLQKMTGASMHAEKATNALNAASSRSSVSSEAMAQASEMVATAQARAATATKATTAALNAQRAAARSVAATQRNLSYQLIDIGQALATAPTMGIYALQNLGFQVAQIGQLYMGQGGFNQAIKDSARQVGAFASRLGPMALAAGAVAATFAGMTYEINKVSDVSVSMGDVVRANILVIRDGAIAAAQSIYQTLQPAIAAISPWIAAGWSGYVTIFKTQWNSMIAAGKTAFDAIRIIWDDFPDIMGDIAVRAGNLFLSGIDSMLNKALSAIKEFYRTLNPVAKLADRFGNDTISSIFGTGALPDSLSVGRIAPAGSDAAAGAGQDILTAAKQNFSTDYLGSYFNAVADKARELASATDEITGAAGKAADAWNGLRKTVGDTAEKLQQRISNLGQSIGGIFRGLLDQTLSWKDAALQAIQSVLTYLNQQNLARGGAGLFGGGLFGAIAQGFLGFANGGYTGPGGKNVPAGEGGPELLIGANDNECSSDRDRGECDSGSGGRRVVQLPGRQAVQCYILKAPPPTAA